MKEQFACLALAAVFVSFAPRGLAEIREVDVTGGRVAGVPAGGIVSYKGIPFAAPPVRSFWTRTSGRVARRAAATSAATK